MASIPTTTIEPVSGSLSDSTDRADAGNPFPSHSDGADDEPRARQSRIAEISLALRDPSCSPVVGRRLVLEAEVLTVPNTDRLPFVDSLAAYVLRNRDNVDPNTLTAVGSAVRKLVLNLRIDELECQPNLEMSHW